MAVPKVVRDRDRVRRRSCAAPPTRTRSLASSMLINGYVEQPQGRLGLRGRVARPRRARLRAATARSRPRSRPTSSTPCSRTARATTSTTRTPSTPRPSAPTRSSSCCATRRGSGSSPGRCTRPAGCSPRARRSSSTRTTRDGKGNSYGCHENYLVDRAVPFASLVRNLHAVVRDPPGVHRRGQGRHRERRRRRSTTRSAQRADFFEEEVGLETTLKRPIVNTRDEPHADPQKYRRLHVIVGDANLCEVATFLKVGTTAIVLAMIEDDFIDKDLSIIASGARDAHGVARPDVPRPRSSSSTVGSLHRGRAAVGVPAPGARSTPTRPGSRRAAARTSAARCSTAGKRCSPRSSATR